MIKQIPPKYSAVRINGNRAYELSRKGFTDFTLRPRGLNVKKLEIIRRINDDSIMMRMICGKGGYVRSIARDIGEKIGCYAHADQIRRISSGPFTLSNAISDQVIFQQNKTEIFKNILPVQSPLDELTRFDCQISEVKEIKNGKKIPILRKTLLKNSEAFVCFNNQPIAIGKIFNNYFYPKRVFSLYEDDNFNE